MFCPGLRQPALSSTALSVGCPLQESAHFSLESLFGCLLGCRVLQLLRKKIIEIEISVNFNSLWMTLFRWRLLKGTFCPDPVQFIWMERCAYQDLVDVCEVWDFAHSC
ncbi:hypothetical protein DPEC_G00145440 [Dallia pectoralis]|uniref:Uncharacterized protein n=1 Tax=Dallia pectoralis TaxID=75939 RepID=A0ACC2GNL1_DALPE|nr:hypothetical protein DPEC_G00145440 [Dallia pectoralis]